MGYKALFLDRDGVINKDKGYVYKKEDFEFIDGIFDLCQYFQNLGYLIFVVTNQSGIARKYYTQEQFEKLTQWMSQEFFKRNIIISKIYHCPHHPDITGECLCRKPKSGMFFMAREEFDIDLENSVMIGDKESDIEAAMYAGIKQTYLFEPNHLIKETKATKILHNLGDIKDVYS